MALLCLCIAIALLVVPAAAGTTNVTVTRYCDNNYAVVDISNNFTYQELMTIGEYQSNGEVIMQGLVTYDDWVDAGMDPAEFYTEENSGWDPTESVRLSYYGAHNGTLVEDIVEEIGGMPDGSELEVADSTYPRATRHFSKTNVYTPTTGQGEMVLCWWDSEYGFADTWKKGMRLFFYTPDDLKLSNMDMKEVFAPWYYQFSTDKNNESFSGPSAKGLSVQTVDTINIYPPHRYDFATGGDTVKYAYEGGVTGLPTANDVPSATTVDTSKIAANDSVYEQTASEVNGEYAAQRFVFNVTESASNIEKLAFTWDGTSSHDNPNADQGATTYIWKNGTGYETLSGDITSNIGDYVVNGNVTVLVKQNTAQFEDEDENTFLSLLSTDYVKLVVTHHH
ncbi:hypothetical protein J2129_001441 [Methanofollis sp. W23]|uniref:hypothetical protein n=1 Tax=Methanofollis sp. W23 TaxID=2817849 RepID=UPI001AE62AB1|nr:hypothetical protein [Methanofollis sp. W23]MBP2145987.1 hypothetical protein [Methanofollis sp. W23]